MISRRANAVNEQILQIPVFFYSKIKHLFLHAAHTELK